MIQKMQGQTMELDVVGQFYASIITRSQSCVFAISVHLKESVKPQILQQAVNDLMHRLPFLNVRLRRGFFHFKSEIMAKPPQIKPESEEPLFCDFFNRNSGHMIGVSYGERHFMVQTTHVVCDGRSLSKIASSILVRYFEILGEDVDKSHVVDCTESFQTEEAENAYERYVQHASIAAAEKTAPKIKAYRYKASKSAPQQAITQVFDANKVKEAAKAYNATITEYILFQIFKAIKDEQKSKGDNRPITSLIPVDCRSFFPSKSMRSFVSGTTITMPNTDVVSQNMQQIRSQLFEKINKDTVLKDISEIQNMYQSACYVPRILKTLFMKMFAYSEAVYNTTGFSNVGLVKLPAEIENRVERMEFFISLEQDAPYFFSCITVGNALALTGTFRGEGRIVAETVMKNLESQLS